MESKQHTVQLQGNLIPARMLQLENYRVKITSCIQYLKGRPLRLCLHEANHQVCIPTNVTFIFE